MQTWLKITIAVLAVAGAAFGVYWFFFKSTAKKVSPVVAAGKTALPDGYESMAGTGVVTLNGIVVGLDNGDDTWTSTGGTINDFNGNFISNSPMTSQQLAAMFSAFTTTPVGTQLTNPEIMTALQSF
jgi:hypothetical protein